MAHVRCWPSFLLHLGEKLGFGLCFKSTPCSKSSQEGRKALWEEGGYDRGLLRMDTGDGVGGTWWGGGPEAFPSLQPQGGWLSDTWGTQGVRQNPELKWGLTAEKQSRPKTDGLWTEGKPGLIPTEKRHHRAFRGAHLVPGTPEVVAVGVGHSDERFYGVNVLLLHLRDAGAGRQQGEARKGLDVGISLQLQGRQRGDAEIPAWVRRVSHRRDWALVPLLPPAHVGTGCMPINTPGPHQVLRASVLPLPKYLIAHLRTSLSSATDLPSEGAAEQSAECSSRQVNTDFYNSPAGWSIISSLQMRK